MFQSLTDTFDGIFGKLRNKGVLTEGDIDEALKEIRVALLEADVNIAVVRSLRDRIKARALGEEVHKALNPAQQVVKIVNEELTESLGGETISITYNSSRRRHCRHRRSSRHRRRADGAGSRHL